MRLAGVVGAPARAYCRDGARRARHDRAPPPRLAPTSCARTVRSSAGSQPCSPQSRVLCASAGGAALVRCHRRARRRPSCAPRAPLVRGASLRGTERGRTRGEAGGAPVGAPHARLLRAARGVDAYAAMRGDAQRDAPLARLDRGAAEATLPRRGAGPAVGVGGAGRLILKSHYSVSNVHVCSLKKVVHRDQDHTRAT